MLGLALAGLFLLYECLFTDHSVLFSIHEICGGFLFYWYCFTCAIINILLIGGIFLGGVLSLAEKEYGYTLAFGLGGPFFLFLANMLNALYIGGTYAIYLASNTSKVDNIAEWDQKKLTVGCICFVVAILLQINGKSSSKKD